MDVRIIIGALVVIGLLFLDILQLGMRIEGIVLELGEMWGEKN